MKQREQAFKRASASGMAEDFTRYKQLHSEVSNRLDTAKNRHLSEKLADAPDARAKRRELWKFGVVGKGLPSPLTRFSLDELAGHYATVVSGAHARPLSPEDLRSAVSELPQTANTMHFRRVTSQEIAAIINSSSSASSGTDDISSSMLKLLLPALLKPLEVIFYNSLSHGSFPAMWKNSLLHPLAKKKVMQSSLDTRPIAHLCEMSKVLDRLIHKHLSDYLEKNHLLDSRQAGFRKGHSTQTALLGITEDVRIAIDQRKITALILFDFSKAFDTVPHVLLLRKLRR